MKKETKEKLKNYKSIRIVKKAIDHIIQIENSLNKKRKCYICKKEFNRFTKFRGGHKNFSQFLDKVDMVGSDVENYGCMYCGSHDRERHLFMFFDKLNLWQNINNKKVLHFAPEKQLQIKIRQLSPLQYVKADLHPTSNDIQKIDATAIPFGNDVFDILIANHILEHIKDYHKALSEIYRSLKPGGIAILQTPYSRLLKENFEDAGIHTDELRIFFYGQEDHLRVFSEHQFFNSLKRAGFSLKIKNHAELFDSNEAYYYGVPVKEDLIMVEKN